MDIGRDSSTPAAAAFLASAAAAWRRIVSRASLGATAVTGLRIAVGTTVSLGIAVAPPVHAHHSPVAFDTRVTDFSIEGTIESVDVRNPHSVMSVRVENDDGTSTLWDIEFSSVNLLLRRGWDFERLEVGEQVTCTGNPSASGKNEMYMWSIVLADGTEFGR